MRLNLIVNLVVLLYVAETGQCRRDVAMKRVPNDSKSLTPQVASDPSGRDGTLRRSKEDSNEVLVSPDLDSSTAAALEVYHTEEAPVIELLCPPCERIFCNPRRAKQLKCKGGTTRGVCNCCLVCAKTEGESCGGFQWYLGRCGSGLSCEETGGGQLGYSYELSDSPVGGLLETKTKCQPKCTRDFCRRHPKRICSAIDKAEQSQPCQGPCQHTSCSACRQVRSETICRPCHKDDMPCIKRFGTCIRQKYCNRTKYPCMNDVRDYSGRSVDTDGSDGGKKITLKKNKDAADDDGLKFECLVPECL